MFCPKCGQQVHDSAIMCENCGQMLKQDAQPAVPYSNPVNPAPVNAAPYPPVVPQKPENVVAGIVGAVLGALIGAACIILLDLVGYVAAISGLILAICTFKGYELLGGRLTKKGIVISIILILITPYFADRISWALAIQDAFRDYGVTFAECFAVVHEVVETEDYMSSLGLLYLFTALGAFSSIRSHLGGGKKKK